MSASVLQSVVVDAYATALAGIGLWHIALGDVTERLFREPSRVRLVGAGMLVMALPCLAWLSQPYFAIMAVVLVASGALRLFTPGSNIRLQKALYPRWVHGWIMLVGGVVTWGAYRWMKPSSATADAAPLSALASLPSPDAGDSIDVLRESAREVLDRNCGECHTSTLPTALPRALAVYDLAEVDWSRKMSVTQLHDAEGRLKEPIAPTLGEGEARTVHVSSEEMERFRRFVEIEVGRAGRAR